MRSHTTPRHRTGAAILAALATLALAACGQTKTPAAPAPTAAATPASTSPMTVSFGEYFYRPAKVTVHIGQPVRFVNTGKIAHTVADSTAGGQIRSALIQPRPLEHGQSQTVTFTKAGTVYYLCTFHPTLMRGTITVEP